jgi:hypothetical protein
MGSIPDRGNTFSLLHSVPTGFGFQPTSYPMDTGGCFPGRKADNSTQYNAEVNNDGAIPPLPTMFSWSGA